MEGPWTRHGTFCPEGSLTFNSQCTFVFPQLCGDADVPMYMGDRWSYPRQASAATYVWLPMQTDSVSLSISEYLPCWSPIEKPLLNSRTKGDKVEYDFDGSRVAVLGKMTPHGGYAHISIVRHDGDTIRSSLVDFYCRYASEGIRFVTPPLPKSRYKLIVEVAGEHPKWADKRKNDYGSDDDYVIVSRFLTYLPTSQE